MKMFLIMLSGLLFACGDKDEDTGADTAAEETEEAEESTEGEEESGSEDPDTGAEE